MHKKEMNKKSQVKIVGILVVIFLAITLVIALDSAIKDKDDNITGESNSEETNFQAQSDFYIFSAGNTLYWVGNANGNWSNSSNWASSSGGAGGAGVPNSIDKKKYFKKLNVHNIMYLNT